MLATVCDHGAPAHRGTVVRAVSMPTVVHSVYMNARHGPPFEKRPDEGASAMLLLPRRGGVHPRAAQAPAALPLPVGRAPAGGNLNP